MIGENLLRALDLDVVESFESTISPPMTKLFQQLVDRAAANILQAQAQQKHYADARRQEATFPDGDRKDKRRPPHMLEPAGWQPAEEAAEDEDPVFEVEHLLNSRGSGKEEEFLVKRKGFAVEQATWEPLSHLSGCKDLLRAFRRTRTRRGRQQHGTSC
ncbi:hypothetical protein Emag_007331 [Eimeria magna]